MKSFVAALAVLCLLRPFSAAAQCPSISWGAVQTQSDDTGIRDLVALDVDNDGKIDLVGMKDAPPPSSNHDLYKWKGHGDGTFDAPVSLEEQSISDVQLADVNNDGRKDIVMSTFRQVISVRLNLPSGLSAPITTFVSGFQPYRIAVGKFDNDSIPDVAITGYDANLFAIYHGNGDGTFASIRTEPGTHALSLAIGDFDGDGRTDVAYTGPFETSVYVKFRNADGSFTSPVTLAAVDKPFELAAGDFNEDGKTDLVAANWEDFNTFAPLHSIMIWTAGAARTFSRAVVTSRIVNSSMQWPEVKVGDANGDGHLDVIAGGVNGGGNSMTLLGRGDGTFRSSIDRVIPNLYSLTLADVDGDTRPELIVGAYNGLSTYKNDCSTHVHLYPLSPVISTAQAAELRALIGGLVLTPGTARGSVTFKEGAATLGTADVDPAGIAKLDYSGLALGMHTLHAEYSGTGELATGTSLDITVEVISATSSVRLLLPAEAPVYGTPYLVDTEVISRYGYQTSGWIMVKVDGVETQQGWAHTSTKTPLNLTAGPHVLSVHYYGDNLNPPSDSAPVNIVVAKAPTNLAMNGSLTVRQGTSHSLSFTVTSSQGLVPPGTITLKRGSTTLASAPVVNGAASFTLQLERGGHDIVALYSGDSNFAPAAASFTLSVLQNVPFAIDARGLPNGMSIRAVLPPNATGVTLYRRVAGSNTAWQAMNNWSPAGELDAFAARGVLYDYHVEATVDDNLAVSNVDSAILFTDEGLTAGTKLIHHTHFDELRLAVNALRASASLGPFNYDNLAAGQIVRASHLALLRNALTEARTALGMFPATYTDPASAGTIVKAVQVQELRDLAR